MAAIVKGPLVNLRLDVPTWPDDLQKREHNKLSRTSLKETLEYHYYRVLPGHFKSTARAKYGYMPRTEAYKRRKLKQGYGRTDLVRTGMTEQAFTKGPPKIVISGSATSDRGFGGSIELGSFPFMRAAAAKLGMSRYVPKRYRPKNFIVAAVAGIIGGFLQPRAKNTGVTLEQMRKEITCFTAPEAARMAELFLQKYMWGLDVLRGRKERRVYGDKTIHVLRKTA